MTETEHFDVVVMGGGLAGLCFARQLQLIQPGLSVVIIERSEPEIPAATWKVGESTVEFASFYFREVLGLGDYFEERHFKKMGLRFFYTRDNSPFARRPEVGLTQMPGFTTYQIDRGILEADLRSLVAHGNTRLLDSCSVSSLAVGHGGEKHEITCTSRDKGKFRLSCTWLVDASGRRRIIQNQLNLHKPANGKQCSSSWFRVAGRVDLDDIVTDKCDPWHRRTTPGARYFSTNHLLGNGYWVWVIPLSGDATSIGIVCDTAVHPDKGFATYDTAMDWLRENETDFYNLIHARAPLDFRFLRNYSYSSKKVFSGDNWFCVGEAGVFSDPFYSPGSDLIGIGNTLAIDLINRDMELVRDDKLFEKYSRYIIFLNDQLTRFNQHGYDYFSDELVFTCKLLWDISAAWGYMCPQFFNGVLTSEDKQAMLRDSSGYSLGFLAQKLFGLLDQWVSRRQQGEGRLCLEFLDYLSLEWLLDLRDRNLKVHDSTSEFAREFRKNHLIYEELLLAIFMVAVEDVRPDLFESIKEATWLDIRNISLDSEAVKPCEIGRTDMESKTFRPIYDQIRRNFSTA